MATGSVYLLRSRENRLFLALSILVGILAGLSAVAFALCVDRLSRGLFGLEPSMARLLIVPTGISLIAGVLLSWLFPDVRGSGVPQTKAAYQLKGGVIRGRVAIGKFITGVLCVGSGHSMGREGPSVQIGAALASTIGRWVGVSPARIKMLVPVGAAGALSAAFNTPVAAVLFSLEEIIGDLNAAVIGSTVVASVASVVVERSILGNEPLFHVPAYQLVHPSELFWYGVLGIAGGVLSIVFCRSLLAVRARYKRMRIPSALQPAIGGLIIGALLVVRPEVMGVGYEYVDQALNGHLALTTLLVLCLVKMVATIVSYASGNAGGIFAPTLYLGAMVGGAVGTIVHSIAPLPTADSGAYALVGMGTLFAGIIRAPMTSVFMVFEITQDYQILVPLMVANLLSFAISKRFQPVPVYHALLNQDGVFLHSDDSADAPEPVTARQLMRPDGLVLSPTMPVALAVQRLRDAGRERALVGTPDRLIGVVQRRDAELLRDSGRGDDHVETLARPIQAHAHADHRLDVLLERWRAAEGLLPVVRRDDATKLEGVVTLQDITRFLVLPAGGEAAEAQAPQPEETDAVVSSGAPSPG